MTGIAALLASSVPANAVNGNLPGGTSIAVDITGPADNAVVPPGPVTVTGTASIGTGVAVKDTALTYVLDVSGSTASTCSSTNVLGCEVIAGKNLNTNAAAPNTVVGHVGAVVFGSDAAPADVVPAAGDQLLTGPATDANTNGTRDIDEVLNSAAIGGIGQFTAKNVGGGTNYIAGIGSATTVTNAQAEARKIVVFMSDGLATGDVRPAAGAVPADVTYYTFAVGAGASCAGTSYNASLQAIADLTHGTCTAVPDPANLPNVVPGLISAKLTGLTLKVDGGGLIPVTNVTPGLPQTGPASVSFTVATPALGAGTHELCVTAAGTDGGGAGAVTDCTHVVINGPPVVSAGGPYSGNEGSAVPITGTATDPDNPGVGTTWTIAPSSGVDPGTACAFGNANTLSTTVTCNDDGVFTLTLTADDGVNPPVVKTTTVTVANVAPAVTITAPADGALVSPGTPVAVTAPFTDPGSHDTHTCTVDFGDGGPPVPGTITGTTCQASHSYSASGSHTITARVADDDGAAGTAVTHVVTNAAPVVAAGGPYSGQEGTAVEIAGTVTDPDGPDLTTHWTIAPASGVDPGAACAFGNPDALSTTVTCDDDGVWTLTLTASDGVAAPVVKTTTLTLSNVAPHVTISAPADNTVFAHNAPVGVTAPFTDVSAHDTHTCTVDYADGSPIATGTVAQGPGSGTCTASHGYPVSGTYNVLVKVTDDDGGSATAVAKIIVNDPPVVVPGGPYAGNEGAAVSLGGTVVDPDGPPSTVHWSVAPASGVDSGTACVFGNADALATSVTCDDDGVFTLTLSANDGLHPAVVQTTTLTLANVAPVVGITAPTADKVFGPGAPVAVTAPFTDAGKHDTHTCTVDYADGGPLVTGTVAQGACTASHAYAASGTYTITVKVTDDDGGAGTATVRIVVNAPPVVTTGGPYTGNEGGAVPLTGGVTDPDGPVLTTHWSIAPASGVDSGTTCAFGNAAAPATTVTCDDDGVFTLTLSANDSLHPDVVKTTTLTLANVAPVVTITAPVNGANVTRGTPVTFTAPFTDAGKHDTHTCTIDFGDGSPVATGTVAQGAGSGTCSASHAYTGIGAHTVTVKVTDDDGGIGTATVKVVLFVNAEAWAISASGLVTVAKTPLAGCPPSSDKTTASVNVLGLASVNALHAQCTLDVATGRTNASATVSGASLLGGLISVTDIETSCVANEQGLSGSSRVGKINGQVIGTAPVTIGIPGVATVYANQTVAGPNGQLAQYSVRVVTLLGQEIILSGCRMGF
ncbi:PKD domain-containing protein [Amycolatopsis sp. NPDC088138]|uniref:PKD domain-containing protein n=1 Tax=Amycolatopsis sp. NPDC088138 TaxID=3363938 RepID=UPI0037F804D5